MSIIGLGLAPVTLAPNVKSSAISIVLFAHENVSVFGRKRTKSRGTSGLALVTSNDRGFNERHRRQMVLLGDGPLQIPAIFKSGGAGPFRDICESHVRLQRQ